MLQSQEEEGSEKSPSDVKSNDTPASSKTSTSSSEQVEKSDSHSGVESRQTDEGTVAVAVHGKCPYTRVSSPDSRSSGTASNLSSPSSSPGTRRKSDITLSRYIYGNVSLYTCTMLHTSLM